MATVPIARSGRNGQIRINSVMLVTEEWNFTPYGDTIDITHSELGGGIDQISGCEGAKFTAKGFFDAAENPFDANMALKRGVVKASTVPAAFYPTGTSSSVLARFNGFYVEKCDVSVKIRGRIDFDLELWSRGPQGATVAGADGCFWEYPTGDPGASG